MYTYISQPLNIARGPEHLNNAHRLSYVIRAYHHQTFWLRMLCLYAIEQPEHVTIVPCSVICCSTSGYLSVNDGARVSITNR